MRDIKRRKGSIQSTQQITKAMKLVSTVKLQKAKGRAEQTDPYFQYMYRTVSSILAHSGNIDHPYLRSGESKKKAIVVLTSNRGLAGGYNANVVKLITESDDVAKEDVVIYEVGKIGESYLAYTHFKNTVSQEAQLIRMLPVEVSEPSEEKSSREILMNYEPNEQEALNQIIPKYVTSLFYGALVEAVASENGARMQAMDSATSNAEDMIEDLSLKYNRARQGSITQELTEIIAGANAIE